MKFSCEQKDILPALSVVQRAINTHNTLPILANFCCEASGNRIYVSATNLEISITTSFPANVENEGKITIPAKMFVSYVGLLKKGEMSISLEDGNTLCITSEGSKTKLKCTSADDFPPIPSVEKEESFTLPTGDLKKSIEEIVFACSSSTTRPVLSGVLLWCQKSSAIFAATDSYRLGEKKISLEDKKFENEIKSIIPARTMQELSRILGSVEEKEVEIICSQNQILFKVGKIEFISRIIEGKFPEYSQIIPNQSHTSCTVDISELILAIKRVGLFARENNNNIRCTLSPQQITITTEKTEIGTEEAKVSCEGQGDELQFALNGQYLLEALQSIDEPKVRIQTEGKLSPVVIKPEQKDDVLHVIMPLKV